MKNPTSLTKFTGGRYRVSLDPTWKEERADRRDEKIWYEQILCTGKSEDFICLYSLSPIILKFASSRKKLAKIIWEKISHFAGAKADFIYDGEAVLLFPPEALQIVCEMAGAKKKRSMSPEQKEVVRERLKAYHFKSKNPVVQEGETALN